MHLDAWTLGLFLYFLMYLIDLLTLEESKATVQIQESNSPIGLLIHPRLYPERFIPQHTESRINIGEKPVPCRVFATYETNSKEVRK